LNWIDKIINIEGKDQFINVLVKESFKV
jgi:hypothetical protein